MILLNDSEDSRRYFAGIGGTRFSAAETVEQAISLARGLLSAR